MLPLESSPFWELVVVVNKCSEWVQYKLGGGGRGWKGTKAYGIGTEKGISPGNSWDYNQLRMDVDCLLPLCSAPWMVSGLLPKQVPWVCCPDQERFIQKALEHCCCGNSFQTEGSKHVSARCQTQAQICGLSWNASASLPVEGERAVYLHCSCTLHPSHCIKGGRAGNGTGRKKIPNVIFLLQCD